MSRPADEVTVGGEQAPGVAGRSEPGSSLTAAVVDYGMGNLASVGKALARSGARVTVSSSPSEMENADLLVLPGVGNFEAGMSNIERLGLSDFIRDWERQGRALLGICLGMQLLFERSDEGDARGLGIFLGDVLRLPSDVKVPHMGWNSVDSANTRFAAIDGLLFYFVHSYVCVPSENVTAATTTYGTEFASVVHRDNVTGFQFHPEKSGSVGLRLLGDVVSSHAPAGAAAKTS